MNLLAQLQCNPEIKVTIMHLEHFTTHETLDNISNQSFLADWDKVTQATIVSDIIVLTILASLLQPQAGCVPVFPLDSYVDSGATYTFLYSSSVLSLYAFLKTCCTQWVFDNRTLIGRSFPSWLVPIL